MRVKLLFEPRDLWVGVYWDLDLVYRRPPGRKVGAPEGMCGGGNFYILADGLADGVYACRRLRVYLCLVPLFPLRFELVWPVG